MPIDSQKIYFPEFENYQIFEGKTKVENPEKSYVEAFRYVGNGLGSMASFFGQYNIGTKIKNGGVATLKGLSSVGHYLYELSKPTMKYASDKTVEGVSYLYRKISGNNKDEDNKDNLIIKKTEEEDEGKDSCLIFQLADDDEKEDSQNNNQDYQTLSKVNKENEEEKNEEEKNEEKKIEEENNGEETNEEETNEINIIEMDNSHL